MSVDCTLRVLVFFSSGCQHTLFQNQTGYTKFVDLLPPPVAADGKEEAGEEKTAGAGAFVAKLSTSKVGCGEADIMYMYIYTYTCSRYADLYTHAWSRVRTHI